MYAYLIPFVVLAASVLGTLTGFGISTLILPVLALFMPVYYALIIAAIIHAANSLWTTIIFRESIDWRVALVFGVPAVVASYIAALFVTQFHGPWYARALGVLLISYGLLLSCCPQFGVPKKDASLVIGGLLSGVMAGLFGVRGAVRSLVLSAYNFPNTVYIATSAAIALAVDLFRLTAYLQNGEEITMPVFIWGLLGIPLTYAGVIIAHALTPHISQVQLRRIIAVFLVVVGVKFVLFGA